MSWRPFFVMPLLLVEPINDVNALMSTGLKHVPVLNILRLNLVSGLALDRSAVASQPSGPTEITVDTASRNRHGVDFVSAEVSDWIDCSMLFVSRGNRVLSTSEIQCLHISKLLPARLPVECMLRA